MKILADENLDAPIIRWLRGVGHEVAAVAETDPGQTDADLLDAALLADRVLITRDRDFGELVFRRGTPARGVVLLRLPAPTAEDRLLAFQRVWPRIEEQVDGHFLVVTERKIRVRPI